MLTHQKVALVTGGGQGIGKGIVKRLLKSGMAVAIAEIDAEAGQETADSFRQLGPVRFYEKGSKKGSSLVLAHTGQS